MTDITSESRKTVLETALETAMVPPWMRAFDFSVPGFGSPGYGYVVII